MSGHEPGAGTPLLDYFRKGQVDREIRLMAARGELGLRPHEQAAMLEFLVNDPDPEIARTAVASLQPATGRQATDHLESDESAPPPLADDPTGTVEKIAAMSPGERLQLAMRGTREERAILIRDPNRMVAMAVLSSPKISDSEIEHIAKMSNVSEDVLRVISNSRAWTKNYAILAALVRNSKTPVALSLNMLPRLMEKDVKTLTTDRNISDVVRIAARKRLAPK